MLSPYKHYLIQSAKRGTGRAGLSFLWQGGPLFFAGGEILPKVIRRGQGRPEASLSIAPC